VSEPSARRREAARALWGCVVVAPKRGRGRKRKAEEAIATGSASKENAAPAVNRIADDATTPHSTLRSSQPLHPCFTVMP